MEDKQHEQPIPLHRPDLPLHGADAGRKELRLEQLTWLRKHMLVVNFREDEAVDAAIRALRKATTVDDCRVRRIPVYGMGQARNAVYSQRGDDYLLEAQRVAEENLPNTSDMPENAPKNPPETVEDAENPPKVPPKKRNSGWRC